MRELTTGTVTFLFTDIEGSTALWERWPAAMQMALARHHAILEAATARHDGHVFQIIGDGGVRTCIDSGTRSGRAALDDLVVRQRIT